MRKINAKIEMENLMEAGYDYLYPNNCTDCQNLGYHCEIGCIDAELDAELNAY